MGGFGAVSFSYELNIPFIALCPQASLQGFPIYEAWRSNAVRFPNFKSNIINNGGKKASGYLSCDVLQGVDRVHAACIQKNSHCITLNIPYSFHSVPQVINEYYGLKKLVLEIFNNRFNAKQFKQDF